MFADVPQLLALCLALALWWVLGRGGRRSRNRVRRAQRGETDAERLLEECGYSVVERQLSAGWEIYVDGVPRDAQVPVSYTHLTLPTKA